MLDIKRMRFPLDIILVCIRWYAAYPLSYRHLEEMMQEGVDSEFGKNRTLRNEISSIGAALRVFVVT